ncbi:MAG: amidohydrolase family protein, partial [Pseudomonadota bacterium]
SGEVATRLGLRGVSKSAETIVLERDVRLVALTGGRYHAATISCAESLDVIKDAKKRGLRVTCGVSVNHLTFNENDIGSYRTFFKVRPPLRHEDDRQAMIAGLASGDIDIVVSSHDPQDADTKRRPFAEASDGAAGLETLLSAMLRLHHSEGLELIDVLAPMTSKPAQLFGLPVGRLQQGAIADIIQFDPDRPWVVNKDRLRSRSQNTPFDDARLQGRVLRTLVAGKLEYEYEH